MHKLILASESPRRKILLEQAGFSFHVFSVKVSENIEENLTTAAQINAQIEQIAQTKGEAVLQTYKSLKSEPILILSADTMVIFKGRPLGKPKDSTEAQEFLTLLSGNSHQVKTAICLIEGNFEGGFLKKGRWVQALQTTDVHFRLISRQEIQDYVASGEPMDKAGAYGIQGLGGKFVERIEGPYDNVVGLPVDLLEKVLRENNWVVERTRNDSQAT